MAVLLSLTLLALSAFASGLGPTPVPLGTTKNYAILAESGVSTVPTSAITGNVGLSPAAASYFTGFALTHSADGTYWTSSQVTGKLYAASDNSPTPSTLTTAIGDLVTAYNNASQRANPNYLNLDSGVLSGVTLTPGLYHWGSDLDITGTSYISGASTDTWIFQITGKLVVSPSVKLILEGGAVAGNIVWVVASSVSLGASSQFNGIILGKTAIALASAASINGRLLAQTAVTLNANTVQSTGIGGPSKRSSRYSNKLEN